jgi:DNA polymerase III subunit alpha
VHERIAQAVAECVRLGITVRTPDVNRSRSNFALEDEDGEPVIRFGLATVKNVGHGAADEIVRAREEGGPFTSVEDFAKRVDLRALNKRALESLVKSGALDSLGDRGTLLANVDRIVSLAQREAKLKETGQSTMFDMFGENVATPLPSLELADAQVSKAEQLSWEKDLLGVYVSEHPFSSAALTLSRHTSSLVAEVTPEMDGREVVLAGMVGEVRTRLTKAGKTFLAVTIEDLSGTLEVTVWPDVYEPTRDVWVPGNILLMLVRVRERGDRLQASVQQVSLVQAADGSMSHERFEMPAWLTDAVRASAGVGVVEVQHDGPPEEELPPANGHVGGERPENGAGDGPGAMRADAPADTEERAAASEVMLRFVLHESDDEEADRLRLEALIRVLESHPGPDEMRLFVHTRDGDRIELSMPEARACDELRERGVAALVPNGGVEEAAARRPARTHGVQPLEV